MQPGGVAVARISLASASGLPHLDFCHFHADGGPSDRANTLKEISKKYDLNSAQCVSVAEPGSFNLLLVEAPQVDATELKAAVRWRIKGLIDFHIDDAVIDVFDIPGQEERGRQKMMYAVASRIADVQEHINLLEGSNIGLSVIDIPELAIRNIASLLPEDNNGVALLYFGDRHVTLTLTRQNTFYLSRGSELSIHQMAMESAAESLSDESGIPPALQQLLDTIILDIQRSLDYYESHFSLPPISSLVIAPTALPVPGMMRYLANNLGLPVRILDLNTVLECDEPISETLQAQCLMAIGAALRQEVKTL